MLQGKRKNINMIKGEVQDRKKSSKTFRDKNTISEIKLYKMGLNQ